MTSVPIPESLRREVAEHPERFRPPVKVGQVLALGRVNRPLEQPELVSADDCITGPEDQVLITRRADGTGICATSWAIVGRASDPKTPRPQIGDQVLVLEAMLGCSNTVGHVGTAKAVPTPSACGEFHDSRDEDDRRLADPSAGAILVEFRPGIGELGTYGVTNACRVEAWAILPPALDDAPALVPAAPASRLFGLLSASEGPAEIDTALDQAEQRSAVKVRPARDPDVMIEAADPTNDATGRDEAGWDLDWDARLTFGDDTADAQGLGRGLHVTLSVAGSVQARGGVTKSVTPQQLRAHAQHLVALADRAEARAAEGGVQLV